MRRNRVFNLPQLICALVATVAVTILPFFKFSLIITFYSSSALNAGLSFSPLFLAPVIACVAMLVGSLNALRRPSLFIGAASALVLLVLCTLLSTFLAKTDVTLLLGNLGEVLRFAGVDLRAENLAQAGSELIQQGTGISVSGDYIMSVVKKFLHIDIGYWVALVASLAYCVFSLAGGMPRIGIKLSAPAANDAEGNPY